MTPLEYRAALRWLRLPIAGQETGRLLGITPRCSRYYADGQRPVPPVVAVLLGLLLTLDRAGLWAAVGLPERLKGSRGILRDPPGFNPRSPGAP